MRGQSLYVYATSADMLQLAQQFEEILDFSYAYLESYKRSNVVLTCRASSIDQFWTSPNGFIGRSILLIPKGYTPLPRATEQRDGTTHYSLTPADVEECVVLQEGGIYKQGDCLISGRLTNGLQNAWSKSTFEELAKLAKKQLKRTKSHYLGSEAVELLEDGYRLTFQSSAPLHSDFSCARNS